MFPVVLLLLWPLLFAYADYEQNVTLKFIREVYGGVTKLKCVNEDQFNLKEGIPAMMYIDRPTTLLLNVDKFECYRHDNSEKKIVFGELSQDKYYFNAPIQNIHSLISNKYVCYFLLNKGLTQLIEPQYEHDGYCYIKIDCEFRVAIIYWKSLKVEINENVIDNELVLTSNEVDTKVTYKFVPDELVHIKCKRLDYTKGTIRFLYKADTHYASVPRAVDNVDFQVILKPHHHRTHVDCIFEEDSIKTVLRVYMLLDQKNVEDIIRVNGLAIRQSGDILKYYYTGAVPTISCPGPVDDEISHKSHDQKAEAVCNTGGKVTKVQMYEDYPRNGILIGGLLDNKIIFQTYEDENRTRRIHYTYTDDDDIELRAWYNHQEVYCMGNGLSCVGKEQKLPPLRIGKEYNITNVTCKSCLSIFTTDILFHYVKSDSANNPTLSDPDDAEVHYLYIVAIVPVILLLMSVVGIAVALRNKRNSASKLLQVERAEDIAKTENNIHNKHSPKRLHADIHIEPQKQTVDCAVGVPTGDDISPYSIVSHQNIDDLYTKPIPKNQRVHNKDEINYVELQFEEPGNNMYSQINPVQPKCIYSEVQHVQPNNLYAEVIHEDHNNMNYGNCY